LWQVTSALVIVFETLLHVALGVQIANSLDNFFWHVLFVVSMSVLINDLIKNACILLFKALYFVFEVRESGAKKI
jgi:hypothetical protein